MAGSSAAARKALADIGAAQPQPGAPGEHAGHEAERQLQHRDVERPCLDRARRIFRLVAAEVGCPVELDRHFEDHRETEGDQQRCKLVHLELVEQPMLGRADREHRRHDHRRRPPGLDVVVGAELVDEVGGEEGEREMAEIDQPQQAPAQAETHGEQAIEAAGQDAGDQRLTEKRGAGHPRFTRRSASRRGPRTPSARRLSTPCSAPA